MYLAKAFGIFLFGFIPVVCNASGIIKCTDADGNVVFTKNKLNCNDAEEYKSVELSQQSSTFDKTTVSYRIPRREYARENSKWDIRVESYLLDGDPDLYQSSVTKLNDVLSEIFSILPKRAAQKLSNIRIFLMCGENSPLGGRKNGMSYIRKGEHTNYSYLDPIWEHSVVIYSAKNFKYLNRVWSRKAIMHELAHAWHITNWADNHPPIYNSWVNTKNSNRFQDVPDIKGKTIKNGYARKNHREYFAELSAIYFVGGNYYPYNKDGLKKYDPQGFRVVQGLWQ